MTQIRHLLTLFAAIFWLSACETPITGVQEDYGLATRQATAAMLAERTDGGGPQGIPGSTAQDVIDNYHYNEETQSQKENLDNSGLVEVK